MDRTFSGDLDQLLPLLGGKVSGELKAKIDLIEQTSFCLAAFTILGMNAPVGEGDRNCLQGNLFPARIKPDGHRGAAAEGHEEIVIRPGGSIVSTNAHRFISLKVMSSCNDFLEEASCVSTDNDLGRFDCCDFS